MNPIINSIHDLKNWLKDTAQQIRQARAESKEFQRQHNGSYGSAHSKQVYLSWDYRHYHIAYCELRGRERSEIERPKKGNEPDETRIASIKDAILASIGATKTPA